MIKFSALRIGKYIKFRLGPQCQCIITKMIHHLSGTIIKIKDAWDFLGHRNVHAIFFISPMTFHNSHALMVTISNSNIQFWKWLKFEYGYHWEKERCLENTWSRIRSFSRYILYCYEIEKTWAESYRCKTCLSFPGCLRCKKNYFGFCLIVWSDK